MSTCSTSADAPASVPPSTLRCAPPSSTTAPTSPAHRRLRAAAALLKQEAARASNPSLPAAERHHALTEALRHLDAAWLALTTYALDGDPAVAARASSWLGEVNRRLPLVASDLRGPVSVGKEAA